MAKFYRNVGVMKNKRASSGIWNAAGGVSKM